MATVYAKKVSEETILLRRPGIYSSSVKGWVKCGSVKMALDDGGFGQADPNAFYGFRMINMEIRDLVASRDRQYLDENGFWPVRDLSDETVSRIALHFGELKGLLEKNGARVDAIF